MKRQIHAYRGHEDIAVEGHNIKLGRGGIREIEFFVQTQQLIAGGRHPELRGRDTLATLAALADGGWIGADARDDLDAAYRFLRKIEHRLQMVADDQTHTLPSEREDLERFARFAGFKDRDALCRSRCSVTAQGAAPLRAAVRGHVGAGRRLRCRFPRMPTTARRSTGSAPWAFASRWRSRRRCAAGSPAAIPRSAANSPARQFAELVPVLLDRLARSENPDARAQRLRSLPRRPAARRAAVLAAQAEPRSGHAGRADARHRAAAGRYPGAPSGGDGRAARADLLRRAAGRGQARSRARAHARRIAILRGLSRSAAPVRPGAHVPGRRAHPVGHGVGRAGRRGLCAARRRRDPRAAPQGGGHVRGRTTAASAASRPRCSRSASSAAAR